MAMAARFAEEIVPELVMPPPNVDTVVEATEPPMIRPKRLAETVPELLMPPRTAALSSTRIPCAFALMVPLLVTVPSIVLLVIVMPVLVGGAPPFAVSTPVLVLETLPVTSALFSTRMQLPVAELLLTEATVPPFCVRHAA